MMKLLLLFCFFVMFSAVSAADCGVKNGYSEEIAKGILDAHNTFRSTLATGKWKHWGKPIRFAPTATNMRKMVWNCDFQREAQEATEMLTNDPVCPLKHTQGGQNGYWGNIFYENKTIESSGIDAMKAWETEFILSTGRHLHVHSKNGHATQAAWWNSDRLGCGVSKCQPPKERTIRVFCHYKAASNFDKTPAYEVGETCSNCGKGFKCESKETGLCIPE